MRYVFVMCFLELADAPARKTQTLAESGDVRSWCDLIHQMSTCSNVNNACRGALTEPSVWKMLKWLFSFSSGRLPHAPETPAQI